MPSSDYLQYDGIVSQAKGNAIFLVKVEELNQEVMCTLSGKIRKNAIRILEGDRVSVDVSTYELTKGRITYRYKK